MCSLRNRIFVQDGLRVGGRVVDRLVVLDSVSGSLSLLFLSVYGLALERK